MVAGGNEARTSMEGDRFGAWELSPGSVQEPSQTCSQDCWLITAFGNRLPNGPLT